DRAPGKIATSFRAGGNADDPGLLEPHPGTFVVEKVVGAVPLDGPADAGAELVVTKNRLDGGEKAARVEAVVAEEIACGAGLLGGSRRSCHLDDAAASAAQLSLVVADLDVEFLQSLYRWIEIERGHAE